MEHKLTREQLEEANELETQIMNDELARAHMVDELVWSRKELAKLTAQMKEDGWEQVATVDKLQRSRDEIAKLEATLYMLANGFEYWEEPTPDAPDREWSRRFNTNLHGCVVAQASFTPREWEEVKEWRKD